MVVVALLAACSSLVITATCNGRMDQQECDDVAVFALGNADDTARLGEMREIETTLIDNCADAARRDFVPGLADPSIDRCWRVDARWQRGQTSWTVARDDASGQLRVVE